MEQFFKKLVQIAWVAAAVLVVIGGVYFCLPQIQQLRGLENQKQDLLHQIDLRDRSIRTIKQNQLRFRNSPEFIEQLARKENRIAPNEIVFIFDED